MVSSPSKVLFGEIHVEGERVMVGIRASGKALRNRSAAGQQSHAATDKQDSFHSQIRKIEDAPLAMKGRTRGTTPGSANCYSHIRRLREKGERRSADGPSEHRISGLSPNGRTGLRPALPPHRVRFR